MTSIGKYKLMEEMGVGAVGSTHHASDTFRNREMVLKVLNPQIVNTPELREQICRDLSLAAELRHPHIVTVRDLGEVDGTIYIASELLNGVDLRWHIERRILSLADKIDLMVQVCGALAFAHSKGVAHGDIKPGNIFVTGKDATVLDFGIGKCLASIVEAGARPAALSPNYLAPEQILGKPFKAKSDIFSAAVVFYELLVKYPFPADANLISREIVHTIPEPLRKLDPEIPEELEQLMIRALEKDPEKRLERADEFAAGLYLISQKLRGPAAPAAQTISPEPPSEAPVNLAPPAFAPAFASAPPVPTPTPIPVVLQAPPPPPPEAVIPAPLPAAPPISPVQTAKPVPAPAPGGKLRWIPYAIAAVLTFCISLSIFSRQSIHASQVKPAATAAAQTPAPVTQVQQPVAQQTSAAPTLQTPATVTPAEALPATETAVPAKPSEEQAAMIQVKALWASGKYAQALEKVDDFITSHPENMEGRIWKKKIRAAQDAEAAMK